MRRAVLALVGILPISLWGAENASSACSAASSPEDVVSCALQNHPDVVRLRGQADRLDALDLLARQRPNPDLDVETLHPSDDDEPSLELEASYLHTFETGGKRRRRLESARAQKDLVIAQLDRAREEVKLRTILNLHRLRQIEEELHLIDEASNTFGTIVGQYRSRSRLSPEQEVSLSVFVLAEGDYRLRRSGLIQERGALRQFFKLATGLDFATVMKALPARRAEWPAVPASADPEALGGAARREARAEVAMAQADIGLAAGDAVPNIGVGPRVAATSGNGQNAQSVGAVFSMSLPLYNRNRGGRAVAESELVRAQAVLSQREGEFGAALESWREVYQEAVGSLQDIPSVEQLERKHHNIENQFQRGLISASLVIEAHRQLTDFTASQNEQELKATEALWSIHALRGRILEEKL